MEIPKEYLKNSQDFTVAILSDFYDDNELEVNLYEKTTVGENSYWIESRLNRQKTYLEIVVHKIKKGSHYYLGSSKWDIEKIANGELSSNQLLVLSVSKFINAVIKFKNT